MLTIRSNRLEVLLCLAFLAGLGSTAAEAYDPRVTTRPSDLAGGSPARVVRDHRRPATAPAGGVIVTTTPRDPIVRDHRAAPVVRDHRRPATAPAGGVIVTTTPRDPIVRDHRAAPVVRDHRRPATAPAGGVIVTTTPRDPIVRDHRAAPVVRDHRDARGAGCLGRYCGYGRGHGGPWTAVVRDHRR
jgi:hypothetical protein